MIRISLIRSGGFAGIPMVVNVDSDSLSTEEEREFSGLIEAAGLFQLPESIDSPGGGADRFMYKLTVDVDGHSHSVEVGEAAVPSGLRPLLDRLTSTARRTRQSRPPTS